MCTASFPKQKIRFFILLMLLARSSLPAFAGKPGDSVDSGRHIGHSSMQLAGSVPTFHMVFQDVNLSSQSRQNMFTDYGPYTNLSQGVVRIRLNHTGGGWFQRGMVANVNGVRVADNPDLIEFTVGSGETYGFSAKDLTSITVHATLRDPTTQALGLPSAEDFLHPKGELLYCFTLSSEFETGSDKYYVYREGTFSDKSRLITPRPSEIRYGLPSDYPVDCPVRATLPL